MKLLLSAPRLNENCTEKWIIVKYYWKKILSYHNQIFASFTYSCFAQVPDWLWTTGDLIKKVLSNCITFICKLWIGGIDKGEYRKRLYRVESFNIWLTSSYKWLLNLLTQKQRHYSVQDVLWLCTKFFFVEWKKLI